MLGKGVPLVNNSISKEVQSSGGPAVLLKYSIVMTSSDTIISKGEKWV